MLKRFLCYIAIVLLSAVIPAASWANQNFVLVIDAGHGGKDVGAVGRVAKEKNINLKKIQISFII